MRCPYCHQNIRVQGRFCPKCGEQIFGLPVRQQPPAGSTPPAAPGGAPLPPVVAPPPTPAYQPPSYDAIGPPNTPPPDLAGDTVDIEIDTEPPRPTPWSAAPTGAPPTAPAPAGVHAAAGEEVGKTCPYCRFPIKPGDQVYVCPACKVIHHQDCWQENHGCTTYGCRGSASAAPPAATPPRVYGPQVDSARGPVGGVVPDFALLQARELDGRANNALYMALGGWLCCPPLTLVGLFMGLSLLGELNRAPGATGAARGKAIGAVVVGAAAVVFWIIMLIVQGQQS